MNCTREYVEKQQEAVSTLFEALSQIKDPRSRRGVRYPLAVILTVIVLAKRCGESELRGIAQWAQYRAAELSKGFKLEHQQMPHWTTYSRVLQRLAPEELRSIVHITNQRLGFAGKQLILDGKTLRGTIRPGQAQGEHLVSLYEPASRQVVAQVAVRDKQNEIVAARQLLTEAPLTGSVVTGDALFTQRELSQLVLEAGGDYVWVVKENQPRLFQMIDRLFAEEYVLPGHSPLMTDFRSASQVTKAHGRIEYRRLTASSLLNHYAQWPGIQQVFRLERRRQSGLAAADTEIGYGITSLTATAAGPAELLTFSRRHWAIENQLHYPRDVSLHEDRCRLHSPQAQQCMASLNNLVIALVARSPFTYLPDAQRFFAARLSSAFDFFF
jgi:predicted transposase YbfD/YdcC